MSTCKTNCIMRKSTQKPVNLLTNMRKIFVKVLKKENNYCLGKLTFKMWYKKEKEKTSSTQKSERVTLYQYFLF